MWMSGGSNFIGSSWCWPNSAFRVQSAAVVYPPYSDTLAGVGCHSALPNVMLFHVSCSVSHSLFG